MGVVFALYRAPDLLFTQTLVEAASLLLFLLVFQTLPDFRDAGRGHGLRVLLAVAVGVVFGGFTLWGALREGGWRISLWHLRNAYEQAGGKNVVNVIVVDFRGFDTLGEITVLALATLATLALLRVHPRWIQRAAFPKEPAMRPLAEESVFLRVVARWLFWVILGVGLWVHLRGHGAPGGGFIAGLLMGFAFVIPMIAEDVHQVLRRLPVSPPTLMLSGLGLAAATALLPLLQGKHPLTYGKYAIALPWGTWHFTGALFFDTGVLLVVLGMVLSVLSAISGYRWS